MMARGDIFGPAGGDNCARGAARGIGKSDTIAGTLYNTGRALEVPRRSKSGSLARALLLIARR